MNVAQTVWKFQVIAPMGAVRMTQRSKYVDPRAKRYEEYKTRVRLVANVAGVPDEIPKDKRVVFGLKVAWEKGAKADLDNVIKGVLDALWSQDRRVSTIMAKHYENQGCEDTGFVQLEFEDA